MTQSAQDVQDAVLEFWFTELSPQVWFGGQNDELDGDIKKRFGGLPARVLSGELDELRGSKEGLLAMIIIVDQFTRNMYRGTPEAFHYDGCGLELSRLGVSKGFLSQFTEDTHKLFMLLPMMHQEDLAIQKKLVEILTEQGMSTTYAVHHMNEIEQFGRFPHRNVILGRVSSPEEEAYFKENGTR